jgi:hypothetical protein
MAAYMTIDKTCFWIVERGCAAPSGVNPMQDFGISQLDSYRRVFLTSLAPQQTSTSSEQHLLFVLPSFQLGIFIFFKILFAKRRSRDSREAAKAPAAEEWAANKELISNLYHTLDLPDLRKLMAEEHNFIAS